MSQREQDVFEAVRGGDLTGVLEALKEKPELIHALGVGGATLLQVAAEGDDTGLARALLDRGAEVEAKASWGQSALEWAREGGHHDIAARFKEVTR